MKYNRNWLIALQEENKPLKFIHFWGHKPNADGSIGNSCFSQWWLQPFTVEGKIYPTAEHWMMAEKARLFRDSEIEAKILKTDSPAVAKKLGREVHNFDQVEWEKHRFEIVCKGNLHKFSQHEDLKNYLLNTGDRVLVEASPMDTIWGIGYGKDHPNASIAIKWRGINLLGFALMEVRDLLRQ